MCRPVIVAPSLRTGTLYAAGCLLLLGVMPVITAGRPAGAGALTFAAWLSVWQLACAAPAEARAWLVARRSGATAGGGDRPGGPRTRWVLLGTGVLFAVATWCYVLAFDRAGTVEVAVALQTYPLLAAGLESVALGRRRSAAELAGTVVVLVGLYDLATGGTWRTAGLSGWFAVAVAVPALWSIAHVTLRQVLLTSPVTPRRLTSSRLVVAVACLGPLAVAVDGPGPFARAATDPRLQASAALLGAAYYLELILWFHAVRHLDVSLASTVTVPAPAVTMVLAVPLLGTRLHVHQIVALAVVGAGLAGVLLAARRGRSGARDGEDPVAGGLRIGGRGSGAR